MVVQEEVEKIIEQAMNDEDNEDHTNATAVEKTSWVERLLELVDLYHAGSFCLLGFTWVLIWNESSNSKIEIEEESSVGDVEAAFIWLATRDGYGFMQNESNGSKSSNDLGRHNG